MSEFCRFQSTAHPKAGRNTVVLLAAWDAYVSIHGPPEGRPKRRRGFLTASPPWFQSTAPPEGRPKPMGSSPPRTGQDVSIHGPPEGRPKPGNPSCKALGREGVSIHGPPEGRPKRLSPGLKKPGNPSFNPRPTRRQAETLRRPRVGLRSCVSIHGPPEGRPKRPQKVPERKP